jgi:hypothetical protein
MPVLPSETPLEDFLLVAERCVRSKHDRARLVRLLETWGAAWTGKHRLLNLTASNHGAFLHFTQLIGSHWMQAFTFHATHKDGVRLKGPDPDRGRKSHKHRSQPLDPAKLDALFDAWSAHPEARPAGHAVEFYLEETPDETWQACLEEVLLHLKA